MWTRTPCGLVNKVASCMENSAICDKHFPKEYCYKTYIDKNGYLHYRRRDIGPGSADSGSPFGEHAACQFQKHDQEWAAALKEVAFTATARELCAQILIFCDVSDPVSFWISHWKTTSDDIPRRLSKLLRIPEIHLRGPELEAGVLYELEVASTGYGKSVQDYGTITSELCAEGDIVLVVASLLLPSGRTAHSRFKLPLDLLDESMCDIKNNTQMADLLKQTDLTIWDEAPMNDRCYQTLRDILDVPDKLFGNKLVIFGGDFWQTLSVKKKASKNEVIDSSFTESYMWSHSESISYNRTCDLNIVEYQNTNRHSRIGY
nr:DNA helicase [Tanacetum cinerariifolium]